MYHYEDTPTLRDYYAALERMIKCETLIVQPGTRISRKTVALEASRSESAIKRNRAVFDNLNAAIDSAAKQQAEKQAPGARKVSEANQRLRAAKAKSVGYKELYEHALARELMLLLHIDELERLLGNRSNVIPFDFGRKR
jgi:translation initiation factor 2 beta subunit (eIF-2beta)/eIF-5